MTERGAPSVGHEVIDRIVAAAVHGYGQCGQQDFDYEVRLLQELAGKPEFSPDDFERVVEWKQERGFGKVVRDQNSEESIREVTRLAFASDTPSEAIDCLVNSERGGLKGVQYSTASALLTFHDSTKYTIIDPRAWAALFRLFKAHNLELGKSEWEYDREEINGDIYGNYVSLCKKAAQIHHLSLREMDRALYTLGDALWVLDGLL